MKYISSSDLVEIAIQLSLINDTDDGEINTAQFLYNSFELTIDHAYSLLQNQQGNPPEF